MTSLRREERISKLLKSLDQRILVIDGAMGTAIQEFNLNVSDFGGSDYEGCNEYLVHTRPDVISKIHENYIKGGCDIIETNTFGATPLVLSEFSLGDKARELNIKAAKIARDLADKYSTDSKQIFVAGSMGPTTKSISLTGGITFQQLTDNFHLQAKALFDGDVDYFLIETCQDTRNIKAALVAIDNLFEETKTRIPVAVSVTIEPAGTMLAGQSVEALIASLSHSDLLYLGINCGTGPEFMTDHIRSFALNSPFRIAAVPNAGLPDEEGRFLETPEMMSNILSRFASKGWLNVIGGCCGTHAGHISKLAETAKLYSPRKPTQLSRSCLSGIDYLELTDENRPILIGERTNAIGSRKFKDLISSGKFEEASEIAKSQIKNGAQIIDICLANPDRDELDDTRKFLEATIRKIRVPVMIDSTDEKVIELALTYCQGKAIINSINLENGESRFAKILPLAKKYGAALVVGTIDDHPTNGMGITRERKLSIAEREYELLIDKYKFPPEDIYWDPLVFPCATGDKQYAGSAAETIAAISLIKKRFPRSKTILGISNVSFGLPPSGREVLNAVFLNQCVHAGLDAAIVNAEKLPRFTNIPNTEIELSENLLYNRGNDPIGEMTRYFREKKIKPQHSKNEMPLLERLKQYVIEGSKDGLINDLNEAIKEFKPIELINGPLMQGMDEVGKLFNANQLIVAEVLQSAEVMKAAVSHLEQNMEKKSVGSRGKIILATVKGDVHDIGKNLVDIILTNNGFTVINLGIKVQPETLISAIREHKPDIVGLSGLLVKSAHQMAATADDLAKAGINLPVIVGGAALSEKFVDKKIAESYRGTVFYASDAMHGLELAKVIVDPEQFSLLKQQLDEKRHNLKATENSSHPILQSHNNKRSTTVRILDGFPKPPDYERHVLSNTPIEQIWEFINPLMLYGRHLGIRGETARMLSELDKDPAMEKEILRRDPSALEIWKVVRQLKNEYAGTEILRPSAVYQFFKARSSGNQIILMDVNNNDTASIDLPRQNKPDGLCLADYVAPNPPKITDNIAFFAVSVGKDIRKLATAFKNRGDYLKCHILQVLALESAEAYAEYIHSHIRKAWGFPDAIDMTMLQRFQSKYRGKRYSFGYPACPRLDDQTILFKLVKPEEIGVQLTEGFMMDPEASVSAMVFHHPDTVYFSVGHSGGMHEDNR